jgi:membrane peptidoglycan carboxypeptidase
MWWDSIETLNKFHSILQWTAIVCAILAALANGAAFKFGSRLSSLQNTKDKREATLITDQAKRITELKAELVGRRLTPEMREKMQASRKPMPNNVKLAFTSTQGDRESFFCSGSLQCMQRDGLVC